MKNPDLETYTCLAEFFYRELRSDARPIKNATLVMLGRYYIALVWSLLDWVL